MSLQIKGSGQMGKVTTDNSGSYSPRTLHEERGLIVRMWLWGLSPRVIARTTGVSVSTVHRWVRRWREEGTVNMKSQSFKKRKTTSVPYTCAKPIPRVNIFDTQICCFCNGRPYECSYETRYATTPSKDKDLQQDRGILADIHMSKFLSSSPHPAPTKKWPVNEDNSLLLFLSWKRRMMIHETLLPLQHTAKSSSP